MAQYTTVEKIENYLLIDIDEDFVDQVETWIENMSSFIESETGRVFIADTEATTRLFEVVQKKADTIGGYYESTRDLQIDECIEIDSLTIDDDEVDSSYYLTYPMNTLPITRIRLTDDSGMTFTEGEQNIEVSAKWGYSESVPGEIEFACTVLTAGIINNSWSSEGEVSSVTMGTYSLSFKDEKGLKDLESVKQILAKYKKLTF